MKDDTSMDFDYYQVTIYGNEENPDVVISASKETAMEDAVEKFGKEMVKSVVRLTGYDLASEPDEVARKQFTKNLSTFQGKTSFKLSERYQELSEKKGPCWTGYKKVPGKKDFTPGSCVKEEENIEEKRGLWDNIHAKRKRIKNGSGEKMRKPGSKGAPSSKDLKDSQTEDTKVTNPLLEGEDKLMYLARIGLMDKNEVLLLKRALMQKRSGQPMSVRNRDLLFKLMEKLVAMITGHRHMWNLARRKVVEDIVNDFGDIAISEQWIQLDDWLMEAGYCDPPKTKAEIKKRYPNVETDVKNKNSKDLTPLRTK